MKYESTGEVRPPRDGEWYVQEWMDFSTPCLVAQAHHNFHEECPRVIMRPLAEPKAQRWYVVIPCESKEGAIWKLGYIISRLAWPSELEER